VIILNPKYSILALKKLNINVKKSMLKFSNKIFPKTKK